MGWLGNVWIGLEKEDVAWNGEGKRNRGFVRKICKLRPYFTSVSAWITILKACNFAFSLEILYSQCLICSINSTVLPN